VVALLFKRDRENDGADLFSGKAVKGCEWSSVVWLESTYFDLEFGEYSSMYMISHELPWSIRILETSTLAMAAMSKSGRLIAVVVCGQK
jgi:hypothetical protein